MDPFTQRLLERTRERREMLTKKMADTSPRRKKRTQPLSESQSDNTPTTSVSESDDSPNKRQCLRETEQSIKSDTPAIKSVKSRMQHLVEERQDEWGAVSTSGDSTGNNENEAAIEPCQQSEECLDDRPAPRSRRSRFAALAQSINNWEDDLSYKQFKKEEKPKKTWERPPVESTSSDSPCKPPRTHEYKSEETRRTLGGAVIAKKGSVARASPAQASSTTTEKNRVSTLEVKVSPAVVSRSPSPQKSSPVKSPSKTPTSQKRVAKTEVSNSPARKSPRTSDENELTKKSVSVRLAHWQKKAEESDKTRVEAEPTTQSVSSRLAGWQQKVDKESTPARPGPATKVCNSVTKSTTHAALSPRKQDSDGTTPCTTSPVKPAPISAAKESVLQKTKVFQQQKSPVKSVSPSKIAPATAAIHAKLQTQLKKNWQENEIAEKARKQKEADLAVLQNRWKNGVLRDSSEDVHSGAALEETKPELSVPAVAAGPIPPAPPPPASGSPCKSVQGSAKSPQKKTPAKNTTPQSTRAGKMSAKREQQRDKLRTDFESKLSAMGFEVSGSTGGNKVATLDLTPQRERDYAARAAAAKNNGKQTPLPVKVTEKKATTAAFADAQKTTPVTTKVKARAPPPPVSSPGKKPLGASPVKKRMAPAAPASTPTAGHSIYSIIKKQAANTPAALGQTVMTTSSQQRSMPLQSKASLQDSFDSGESSFESETSEENKSERKYTLSRQSSQTSGHSEQSQFSQHSDSQSATEYSSQAEYTDTESCTTQETENDFDEESSLSDAYESEGGASEISDLLDEAMDETTTTETESDVHTPVPAPRRTRVVRQFTRPKVQDFNSSKKIGTESQSPAKSSCPPQTAVVERRYHTPYQVDKRVTWAAGSEPSTCSSETETEAEPEKRLIYSLDLYRSSKGKKSAPKPHMTVVRHSEHYQPDESEEEIVCLPEKNVKERLQQLQEMINQEQSVIMQTSNALNQCCHSNSAFAGSAEAVECHRLLLLACKKREAYLTEMSRLRDTQPPRRSGPRGSLTISDLRLPLKKDFQARLTNAQGVSQVHYFLVMVRHENHVIFSQLVSTQEATRGCLDLPNLIKYNDIRQNFKVHLEVYGMFISKEPVSQTPKKKAKTPKKGKGKALGLQSPGGPLAVRSTNFVCVAHLTITQQSIKQTHFNLDGVPYSSPLQGTIHLKLRCIMENNVEERGFLTMFEDVSGFGAWHRRWCALKNNCLSYWKYPEEEKLKEPMGYIDLKQCISDSIGVIPRDICARPNTFEIVTIRRQARGEIDTLVSRCYNTMTTTKHWISADIKEDRIVWCNRLNEALRNIRAWNPDALRPIKRQ